MSSLEGLSSLTSSLTVNEDAVSSSCADSLLLSLPDAVVLDILKHLSFTDVLICQAVCTRLLALGREQIIWRTLSRLSFAQHISQQTQAQEPLWHSWFKKRHQMEGRWAAARPSASYELLSHAGTVFGVACLPTGDGPTLLASGGEDATIRVWDVGRRRVVASSMAPALQGIFNVQSWLPAEGAAPLVAASGFSGDVNLYRYVAPSGAPTADPLGSRTALELAATFVGHVAPVVSCRGRGGWLATCSFDSSVRLWRADRALEEQGSGGAPLVVADCAALLAEPLSDEAESSPHEHSVACLCLPPAAPERLVRGGNDSLIKIWDVAAKRVVRELHGHAGWVWCVEALDPQGQVLVSGATDMTVRVWDSREPAQGGGQVGVQLINGSGPVAGLKVMADSHRVVTGSFDGCVRVWDLRRLRSGGGDDGPKALLGALHGHTDRVTRVDCCLDSIFSASFDSSVRVWRFD